MIRKRVLAVVAVLSMAGAVWAAPRQGVLKDKDGRTYEGLIDERDDQVLVNQRGIESRIPRANILSIVYGDFDELFKNAHAALKKDDVAGRVTLGRKAFDSKRYDLAQMVLEEAVAIDPNSTEASEMLRLTLSHNRFDKSGGHSDNSGGSTSTGGSTGSTHGAWSTLNPQQINRIRQLELDPSQDQKVGISFDKGVKGKYFDANPNMVIDNQPIDRVTWNRQHPFFVATQIIKNGGDLAQDVRITGDPATILAFKKTVQPIILQGCATSACHGGSNEASKKFPLIHPAGDNASTYTNFYVLTTFKAKASNELSAENVFAPTMVKMVDRTSPDKSMILSYGLPQQMADLKHPPVKNMPAIFTKGGKTDDRYTKVLAWIQSLDDIDKESEYGFSFMPERAADAAHTTPDATTKPAMPAPTPTAPTPTAPTPTAPIPTAPTAPVAPGTK